ncbi:MAG: hypothetical protein A3C84_00295 [Candidatus Ryanbacteria bacterium RIFCSPHIGHO2_02_FULL_48_12]|uniref:Serine protease n=1 Tax=Candidatus Ryanbacteria bacterium RIFCSPHIGHO2_01_FULL_48_27 TaxID=1802115 RepID=A0A1G2G578_9BACT|nr:MAG: hypothetical protein A2756_00145 [Candidatus Ryanbacteria bacterium RIFCSPHIGHO2_01_FULL_48_27]OGZ50416.1 MAG: hypothetical protein A3C84_00295 [Candidatus Ryanbacteria bacterium RIFCSPHIGHO2_02_FULL_48_12]
MSTRIILASTLLALLFAILVFEKNLLPRLVIDIPKNPPIFQDIASSTEESATSSTETYTKTTTTPGTREPQKENLQPAQSKKDREVILQKLQQDLQNAQAAFDAIKIPAPVPTPHKDRIPQAELYAHAASRVVNFFCDVGNGEISVATGILVSDKGYIITNAHVAEETKSQRCLVRQGSPAHAYAFVERVFMPKNFSITKHSDENLRQDVSIWRVVSSANQTPLPVSFPAFTIDPTKEAVIGTALATFSYPAELLGFQAITTYLYLSFSETIVEAKDAYFIQSLQSLGSQKGSSGGALIDPYTGDFIGLIFAVSESKNMDISSRKLFSLSARAIDEVVYNETGKHLYAYLETNP